MKAREIMTGDPACLTPDDTVSRAAQLMRENDCGAIPVVDDRTGMHLRGIITDRDLAIRHTAERHTDDCRVGDHMTTERLTCVRPDADLSEVLRSMERDRVRRVPVVEDGDRLVGMIAQADVALERDGGSDVGELVEEISEPEP